MTYRRRVAAVNRLDLHSSPVGILGAMRLAYQVAAVRRYARFLDFSRRSSDHRVINSNNSPANDTACIYLKLNRAESEMFSTREGKHRIIVNNWRRDGGNRRESRGARDNKTRRRTSSQPEDKLSRAFSLKNRSDLSPRRRQ